MQYLDTGWFGIVVTLVMVTFILFNIYRAQKGKKELFIRRIPGLNAIDDSIGRATEMGRPIIMVPGIGTLNAVSVQALNVFAHVTKIAAQFATPIKLCIADAAVYTVAQEIIRETYQKQGLIERYDVDSVRFVSDRQFAFAAGVSGTILREKAAATFLLGEFYAESLIFAETANSVGAIQVAGSTQTAQTPFFIAACDYVLIGDEFYAASAYLSRIPVLVGSLVGQDWCKLLVACFVIFGFLGMSIERTQQTTMARVGFSDAEPERFEQMSDEEKSVYESTERLLEQEPALKTRADTSVYRLFNPLITDKDITIERPQKPETGGGQ
ncbi:MAG: hypothetical protein KIT11_11890 [Fimbriimonadaceae bacterium]|nr:hypothetical protein [Fimbriimonadaceae bacterium]QYK55264.1 MAG: hypothetical protein KF733_09645 [Fimbriimonadaceae bacterium]